MNNMHNCRRLFSRLFLLAACVTLTLALPLGPAEFAHAQDSPFDSKQIVPFVPSPQVVVDKMIELAAVAQGDLLYDMGSGDGRIVIAAAGKGAKVVGFEIDGDLVKLSRENIQKAKLENLAEIRQQDILGVDLAAASAVTLYLLPDVNLKLKPRLLSQLRPGSRIVSHSFDMDDWKPYKVERVDGRTIYLWIVPPRVR
jgi:phospholipid N-methyltransferase